MKDLYKNWLKRIAVAYMLLISGTIYSANVPSIDNEVTIIAREQPIESFLKELFGQLSVPIVIDESVVGTVNGSFENTSARKIFNDIAKSFGLVKYYDGAVVYIYTSNNITRRILPASNSISKRIVRAASELDLTDSKNSIRNAVDGGLVVTGTKRFIEQIDELVFAAENGLKDYEPPVGFKVFYLKYAWAQDVTLTFAGRQVVIPGVATILRQLLEDSPQTYIINNAKDSLINPTLPGLRGQGLNSIGTAERIGLPDNSDIKYANQQRTQYVPIAAGNYNKESYSSNVRIQADPRLNAIIIRDSPDRMARYKHLIDSLDVEPQMLEIEATIIDINTDKLRQLGINWRWQNNNDEILFGSGNQASDEALDTVGQITPFGRGGFISFVLGDNAKFIGRINALEAEGAAHIVSRPHVLTLSNVEAIFDTSSTFYVRIAGREEVDLFNVSVGTSLRVTPHVFKDDGKARIKLLITIEDGQQTNQRVDGIPVVDRSAINTQALINAGESVLVGGLVREITRENEDKVPFLGDIPVMGNLFKNNGKEKTRIERIFLIAPKLAVHKMARTQDISSIISERVNSNLDTTANSSNENNPISKRSDKERNPQSWELLLDM